MLISFSLQGHYLAQDGKLPCSDERSNQFDFWIGEWDLTWIDKDGNTQAGENEITKVLGGCVIEENFRTISDPAFIGNSVSVFSPAAGKWHQTWVDNRGGYLEFEGGMEEEKMILSRTMENEGDTIQFRMVFHNIAEDSFLWSWESSIDGGSSWKLLWKINYLRKGSG